MIEDLAIRVRKDLRARGFPYPVFADSEHLDRANMRNAIVFERDRESGDSVQLPRNAKGHNRVEIPFWRWVGGVVYVYAASHKAGATEGEHVCECDLVCDGVLTAIYRLTKAAGLLLEIVDSRHIRKEDLRYEDLQQWPGAVARIRFRIATAVRDLDYKGNARPQGSPINDVANTYAATVEGVPNP